MTEPRSGGGLSETTKNHCIDLFVASKYNRHTDIFNKYVNKGLLVEEDSITLYSLMKKKFLKKNSERIFNEYINGEPDLFKGKSISNADEIIDIKSSWDLYTFNRAKFGKLNMHYYWQMQGYMWLTNAKKATLAYCLINTPYQIILDEKRKLMWKMGVATDEDEDYLKASLELEFNMTFDDIDKSERVNEIVIDRDDNAIESIKNRVIECRKFVNEKILSF